MSLHTLVKQAEKLVTDNSPVILTSIGVAGTIATAVLAGRASLKAARIIDAEQQVWRHEGNPPLKHIVKLVWPLYIPTVSTGVCTVAAIIFANKIGSRRTAAIAAAYTISQEAIAEYKEKVVESIGENKERKIRDEVAQDRIDRNPAAGQAIFVANGGDVLCYESMTGRYFYSDMETLRKAENDINRKIRHESSASLSDFYDLVRLPHTDISEDVGWNLDHELELDISGAVLKEGKPCLVVTYSFQPVRRFHRLV